VCCGTKRLVEIRCPPDCGYLASAREHPPAVALRRHQQDVDSAVQLLRDLNERQTRLFFLVATFIARYQPSELHQLADADVAEAAAALAATYETASRGVIYEHQAASASGARLAAALKGLLAEAGKGGGTPFERDTAVVLRRLEGAARDARAGGSAPRLLVEMLVRITARSGNDGGGGTEGPPEEPSRLIVP
jgi:hypothetical protein